MIDTNSRYKLNAEQVVSKVMDGEAILINLANGMYYSLQGTGGIAWTLISSGLSLKETCERLSAAYNVAVSDVEAGVTELVKELLEENIVIAVPDRASPPSSDAPEPSMDGTYESPRLVKYADMADILAIDPPMPKIQTGN